MSRRALLRSFACASIAASCATARAEAVALHAPLSRWQPGYLELHHIDTGRGNSTLAIFPDGTTLLIDAGDVVGATAETVVAPRPSAAVSAGDAIANYVEQNAPAAKLDYFLATHIHPDHVASLPTVAARLPVDCVIDRQFPNYDAGKKPTDAPWAKTYTELLQARRRKGERVVAAEVGSTKQIVPKKPVKDFVLRILAANGDVWNSRTDAVDHFPSTVRAAENSFSIALHLRYGAFTYFTGGDLNSDTHDGRSPELDIESPTVKSAGRVEVSVADHHGYFDACGPNFTNALDAQAYIIPSWDIGHPGSAQMQRMLGAWDGKAAHNVFALELHPDNARVNRRFAPQLKSTSGHVVVRVAPGGASYDIYTVDATSTKPNVTGVFGPYRSRG